jgi:acetyl-CoA carboxylase carboxyltransferase component
LPTLRSTADVAGETYRQNRAAQLAAVAALEEQLGLARAGGGAKYAERHHKRGRLLVRERLELLLDRDAPFLELSALAAWRSHARTGCR